MIGRTIGHFRVLEKVGAGGMGEVYRATDTTLDRDVAIKLLPTSFASDPERLARFEREAKMLAALNHPNIAHVYGFESAGLDDGTSVHFVVMELVPGDDLAARLTRGSIPLDEALAIAKQIAEALEDAHEKGIVHRDLKPANVKVTPGGTVKVLDFGLAKALGADGAGASSALSQSPTMAHAGTEAGVILGTAAYMSPEQARGKQVDKRTDIWAFGVLLFEMLTGYQVFGGETVSDILAAVLTREPEWSRLPARTPAVVRRLLQRCLERDPKRRLRDIGEARLALEGMSVAEAGPGRGPRFLAAAAAALALAGIGFLAGWTLRRSSPETVRKADISDEAIRTEDGFAPTLSPGGERVLYFTRGGLRVRELDQTDARTIAGTEGATRAFWSPDGREIGFFRDGALYRVTLDGGAPQRIAETGPAVGGAGACWGADGRIVYSLGNTGLFELSARGSEPRVLLAPDPAKGEDHFHGCAFLPGGRAFVYVVHPRDAPPNTLAVFENGRSHVLLRQATDLSRPAFSLASGHVIFERHGAGQDGVWALPFSSSSLTATGEPFLIAAGATMPSVAADGSLLYLAARPRRPSVLVWVSHSGRREATAVTFPDEVTGIALSRDGRRVAAGVIESGGSDLWVADLERGSRTRLTFGAGTAAAPAWSPDGTRIAFEENNQIFVVPADGSSKARAVGPGLQPFFGVDGRTILAHRPHVTSPRSLYEIVQLDAAGGSEPRVVLSDSVSVRFPLLSPDGRLLAYDRGDGNDIESFLTRFPDIEGRWQVSAVGGTFLRWSGDGTRLFYFAPTGSNAEEGLFEVDVRAGNAIALGIPRQLFTLSSVGAAAAEYEVGPADRFLMIGRDPGASPTHLVLVQHWFAEFR